MWCLGILQAEHRGGDVGQIREVGLWVAAFLEEKIAHLGLPVAKLRRQARVYQVLKSRRAAHSSRTKPRSRSETILRWENSSL